MADEQSSNKSTQQPDFWDSYLKVFLAAVPPVSPETKSSAEQALHAITEIAKSVPGQVSDAFKMLVEFLQELTNIKGVDVQVKSWRTLDIRLNTMKEADVPLNRDLAGVGKVEAVRLSKLIHIQVEIGEGNKDLSLRIHEGIAIVLTFAFFTGKQVIPLKGTAKIVRDDKGQLLVESTTYMPGTNLPLTVSFPLKQILSEIRKQM
ncbi:MAG: hypothetical protein K2X77_25920 [Candidatus Obscuribacterales bacterium]|nr:hypothetical protein [Candidatus Obscuribacterales bacterium]